MLPSLVDVAGTISSICLLTVISYLTGLYHPAVICLLIQWAVAIFQAIPQQRETYYDVTGSVTFAIVSLRSVLHSKVRDWHSILLSILVWIWCVRLGAYLFQRIRRSGQDARFATIRSNPVLFFSAWSLQGFWVFNTLLPVLLSHQHRASLPDGVKPVQWTDVVGALTSWMLCNTSNFDVPRVTCVGSWVLYRNYCGCTKKSISCGSE